MFVAFFKMFDMFASLQSFGSSPVSKDFWKIILRIGDIFVHSLSILLGKLSGPEAFDGFEEFR